MIYSDATATSTLVKRKTLGSVSFKKPLGVVGSTPLSLFFSHIFSLGLFDSNISVNTALAKSQASGTLKLFPRARQACTASHPRAI